MKRYVVLDNPIRIVRDIFAPSVSQPRLPGPESIAQSRQAEQAAAEQASRQARAAAAAQTGRRTTLLSGAGTPQSEVQTRRRTLLGSTA